MNIVVRKNLVNYIRYCCYSHLYLTILDTFVTVYQLNLFMYL